MPAVDNSITQQTANIALTATEANLTPGSAPNGISMPPMPSGRSTPIAIAFVHIPNVTGVSAGASLTVNVRTGSLAGTIIASGVNTNNGAGVGAFHPGTVVALVPAGTGAIFIGGVLSAGTATVANSAAAPTAVAFIFLD
jgi:hypothetical protein